MRGMHTQKLNNERTNEQTTTENKQNKNCNRMRILLYDAHHFWVLNCLFTQIKPVLAQFDACQCRFYPNTIFQLEPQRADDK